MSEEDPTKPPAAEAAAFVLHGAAITSSAAIVAPHVTAFGGGDGRLHAVNMSAVPPYQVWSHDSSTSQRWSGVPSPALASPTWRMCVLCVSLSLPPARPCVFATAGATVPSTPVSNGDYLAYGSVRLPQPSTCDPHSTRCFSQCSCSPRRPIWRCMCWMRLQEWSRLVSMLVGLC